MTDSKYLKWLAKHVDGDLKEYSQLFEYLLDREFIYSIDRDHNRAIDGIKLRDIYESQGHRLGREWQENGCSVLEMMIGLAIRIETNIMGEPGDDHPEHWFWIFLGNLGIDLQTDDCFDEPFVAQKLDIWLKREFKSNGNGSIFPLIKPENDQREVEIWNQMSYFLNENY